MTAMTGHGLSRRETRDDYRISSVGTARSVKQSLTQFATWQKDRGRDLHHAEPADGRAWLAERAGSIGPKTLDQNRQSLEAFFASRGEALGLEKSDCRSTADRPTGLANTQRYYTPRQIRLIAERQTARHALATIVASEAGLRAHELATLARPDEQPRSPRPWRADRFAGRGEGVIYTVAGKGGLIREIMLGRDTAARLEATRLDQPRAIRDRSVDQVQRYDLGTGKNWSQSFGNASRAALGWSTGAHSVRHGYADTRMETLQFLGYQYTEAKTVVAEELGHWKAETTNTYLR